MISLSYSVSLILKQSCEWHVKWYWHVTLVSGWLAVSLRVVHYLGFITAFFFLLQMLHYEVQETTQMWQNEKMQTQYYLEMPVLWFSWWPSPPCSRRTKPLYLFSGGLVTPSSFSVMPCAAERRGWVKMIAWGCLFLSKSFLTTKPGSHWQRLPWILRT